MRIGRRQPATILETAADLERSWNRADKAREHLEKSSILRETLVREAPGQPQLVVELASGYQSLASLERNGGNLPRAVECMQKVMPPLLRLFEERPDDPFTRNHIEVCWKQTGFLQLQLGSFAEAARAWSSAASLGSAARPMHELGRAIAEALAGKDAAGAAAACDAALKLPALDLGLAYDMACIASVAAGALPPDHAAREPLLERALELLRACVRLGFRDAAHMQADSDLDPLRGREGFQALVRELEPQPR